VIVTVVGCAGAAQADSANRAAITTPLDQTRASCERWTIRRR